MIVRMEIESEGAVTRVEREYEPTLTSDPRIIEFRGEVPIHDFSEREVPMLEHVTASVASAAAAAHRVHVN